MNDLAKYLRCSSSPMVNCPLDCPYLIKEEIKEGIPLKADIVIDGVEYWTSCDVDRVAKDAADYIEQLENGSKGTRAIVVNAEYFKELKKDLREYMEKEKKYRWHDLRKNPDDLPEDEQRVLFFTRMYEGEEQYEVRYWSGKYFDYYKEFCNDDCEACVTYGTYKKEDVIAWREIEPFGEVE